MIDSSGSTKRAPFETKRKKQDGSQQNNSHILFIGFLNSNTRLVLIEKVIARYQ
ncbi:MAG TPA: hypothetical protein VFR94_15280 [Nitrososphaeraceae archaeon]|nr:hypothetical protein [Nitrososphaeraceae archaeon]